MLVTLSDPGRLLGAVEKSNSLLFQRHDSATETPELSKWVRGPFLALSRPSIPPPPHLSIISPTDLRSPQPPLNCPLLPRLPLLLLHLSLSAPSPSPWLFVSPPRSLHLSFSSFLFTLFSPPLPQPPNLSF